MTDASERNQPTHPVAVAPARFAAMSWDTVRAASRPCRKAKQAATTSRSRQALERYAAAITGRFA